MGFVMSGMRSHLQLVEALLDRFTSDQLEPMGFTDDEWSLIYGLRRDLALTGIDVEMLDDGPPDPDAELLPPTPIAEIDESDMGLPPRIRKVVAILASNLAEIDESLPDVISLDAHRQAYREVTGRDVTDAAAA